jgi:uncharacterized repeat protein (TIGR04076 family)
MRTRGSQKMARAKVKITVLKRVDPSIIFDDNIPKNPATDKKFGICTAFKEGQEFILDEKGTKPEGFCIWAWNDLFKDISILHFGGNFPWMKEGEMITCCTDGIRPVSFKLERIN